MLRDFQIDHMLPDGGAEGSLRQRPVGPQHLIVVKGGLNGQGRQGSRRVATAERRLLVHLSRLLVEIKRRWKLTMDQTEADAIRKGFAVCGRFRSGDHLDGRH